MPTRALRPAVPPTRMRWSLSRPSAIRQRRRAGRRSSSLVVAMEAPSLGPQRAIMRHQILQIQRVPTMSQLAHPSQLPSASVHQRRARHKSFQPSPCFSRLAHRPLCLHPRPRPLLLPLQRPSSFSLWQLPRLPHLHLRLRPYRTVRQPFLYGQKLCARRSIPCRASI